MKKLKPFISSIFLMVVCLLISTYYLVRPCNNRSKTIVKGETYLYSTDWDTDDPFSKMRIDTVKVLDIQDGYVKHLDIGSDSAYYNSCSINFFKKYSKPYQSNIH